MTKIIDVTSLSSNEKLQKIFDMPVKSNDLVGAAREFIQANGIRNGLEPGSETVKPFDADFEKLESNALKVFEALSNIDTGPSVSSIDCMYASGFKLGSILMDLAEANIELHASIQGQAFKGPKLLFLKVSYEGTILGNPALVDYPLKPGVWLNEVLSVNTALLATEYERLHYWPSTLTRIELPFEQALGFVGNIADSSFSKYPYEQFSAAQSREEATNANPFIERSPCVITFYTEDLENPSAATLTNWIHEGLVEEYSVIKIQRRESVVDLRLRRGSSKRPFQFRILGDGYASVLKNIEKAVDDFNAELVEGRLPAAKKGLG